MDTAWLISLAAKPLMPRKLQVRPQYISRGTIPISTAPEKMRLPKKAPASRARGPGCQTRERNTKHLFSKNAASTATIQAAVLPAVTPTWPKVTSRVYTTQLIPVTAKPAIR